MAKLILDGLVVDTCRVQISRNFFLPGWSRGPAPARGPSFDEKPACVEAASMPLPVEQGVIREGISPS